MSGFDEDNFVGFLENNKPTVAKFKKVFGPKEMTFYYLSSKQISKCN
jgi:hypothetical protein